MTLTPGTKLGPYEILAPIGSGGMGEVWKARDTRLGRIVAIKKVKEQHSERFKQEARTIAALNHPNICQIHDIGSDYLVLEYVEGKSPSSPLPEKEAVRLAIQIASALEAAHKKGIIHRDLKPGNIMVTEEGSVKLLDFGLAKLYEQSTGETTADFPATQAGAVLGTVAYMSPEQAQGQAVDARSDIFSFGLVLYEMLSGRRAFAGDSNFAIMTSIVNEDPPPLQTSSSLGKIVQRCLVKQPSVRYQAIAEVRTALEAVSREMEAESSTEPQPSIAVLPFVNMSGDKEQEYFSDGLAEEIINALTNLPGLRVAGRTSSFFFRGKDVEFSEIGKKLNVGHILEGSVRKAGSRIRVTAQLINVDDGFHLWSERYDREMTDVFAIQDEISQKIAEKLRVRLSKPGPFVKRHTNNVEAYNLYLRGHYHLLKASTEGMAKGKEYLQQALALDPDYALAWYGLAVFHWEQSHMGIIPPMEAYGQSRQASSRALELDKMMPEAHAIAGVLRAADFDWKEAEHEFRRALELDPKSSDAAFWYTWSCLIPMKRLEESIITVRKALDLDPLSPLLQWCLGYVFHLKGEWEQAIEQCQNSLELDTNYTQPLLNLGAIYLMTGELDLAIQAFERASNLTGRSPLMLGYLGFGYARAGRIEEAQGLIDELNDRARNACAPSSSIARIHLGLGEIDRCVTRLEQSIDERDGSTIYFHVEPICDPLRSHPRYRALLRKMNLEV